MFVEGAIGNNVALEIAKFDQPGSRLIEIENKAAVAALLSFLRADGTSHPMPGESKYEDEPIFDKDSLLHTPIKPGSVSVVVTGLSNLVDTNRDGVLHLDREVGSLLSSGTNGATSGKTLTAAGENFTTDEVVAGDLLVLLDSADKGVYTVVTPGTTTCVVDRDFPVGSQTSVTYHVIAQDVVAGRLDYFSGLIDLNYPSNIAPSGKASVAGSVAFPINLEPGDILSADVDGGGAQNATFDAAAATLDGSGGSFAAMASETMEVRFKVGGVWGGWQLITFGTEATQQLAVDLMNAQMTGGYAVINGANVDIISDGKGTGASVATQNVAAGITTKLGIANDDSDNGTGDVSNIHAVTFAEAKALIEADIKTASPGDKVVCSLDETGYLRITNTTAEVGSDSTITMGGTARTKFGFDDSEHAGDDEDASVGATANYTSTTSYAANSRSQIRMPHSQLAGDVVCYGAGDGGSGTVRLTY